MAREAVGGRNEDDERALFALARGWWVATECTVYPGTGISVCLEQPMVLDEYCDFLK